MNILYIGKQVLFPQNGGDMIEYRNQRLLERISLGAIKYMDPEAMDLKSFSSRIGMGVSVKFLKSIKMEFSRDDYDLVFVSQSYYGRCTRYIKKEINNIPVLSFFHNAESDFFYEVYKNNKSLRTYLYFKKAQFWEMLSTHYADKIITLNERDSNRLKVLYGRESDYILPTTFRDSYHPLDTKEKDIDYLFLGSSFYANNEGVQFFLDNVMPYIPGHLCIAGKNMDKVNFNNLTNRVTILGFIDNLNEIYARSRFVISPIFSGSGMKTKTAEALMYGKTIIGTREAFEGYKYDSKCMIECNTAEEFIQTLSELYNSDNWEVNTFAREHFLKNYSDDCVYNYLNKILLEVCR